MRRTGYYHTKEAVVHAIRQLVAEHGFPNHFSAGEVGDKAFISAMNIGKIAPYAVKRLTSEAWGIEYGNGNFHILYAPENYHGSE